MLMCCWNNFLYKVKCCFRCFCYLIGDFLCGIMRKIKQCCLLCMDFYQMLNDSVGIIGIIFFCLCLVCNKQFFMCCMIVYFGKRWLLGGIQQWNQLFVIQIFFVSCFCCQCNFLFIYFCQLCDIVYNQIVGFICCQ